MLKIDVEPITPELLNKKTAHFAYIKHTQEEATVLRDLVKHVKSKYPLDRSLESACRKVKSSLKDKDCVVAPKGTGNVQHSKLNANSELKCVKFSKSKVLKSVSANKKEPSQSWGSLVSDVPSPLIAECRCQIDL
ncbi:hypothetical protein Tco_0285227 [Tanacetum coccineum]